MSYGIVSIVVATGQLVKGVEEELYEVCERVHSSCNGDCPVYLVNDGPLFPEASDKGCMCFKDGAAMYSFITSKTRRIK